MFYVAKTKALISCAVTAQLICGFVFAYAKSSTNVEILNNGIHHGKCLSLHDY